ncbi:MAG: hypothetical protein KJ793_03180, partial [Candidatus Omnitrophica bacterium]|nr:hypothetical protein [Candidatus Omnitrophota bacterium]
VAIIGGREELFRSKHYFGSLLDRNITNLTGQTSLKQLAGMLKKSKLLISGDSGPMHLSCAVGTPTVAIFRDDLAEKSPKRWGPWGEGHRVIAKKRLADIRVDEVYDAVKEVLLRK